MLGLFKHKPLVDADSARWMGELFAWALRHFDADFFQARTELVLPTNAHFPGRADSAEAMARNLFEHSLAFSGLSHWHCTLVDQQRQAELPPPRLPAGAGRRGATVEAETPRLTLGYHPQQLRDPQALVASYATQLGACLAATAEEPPPATAQQQPLVAELLGIYLGFGVMYANSAFAFKAGCGGCRTPAQSRVAYLTQDEATFALALFCALKGLPAAAVTPHLKRHLRPLFKRARRDLGRHPVALPS